MFYHIVLFLVVMSRVDVGFAVSRLVVMSYVMVCFMLCSADCRAVSKEQKGTKQPKAKQRKAKSKAKLNQARQGNATPGGTCYASWHIFRCVAVSPFLCCVVLFF